MTDESTGRADERDVAWRMAVELYNRPTWPTGMWIGSPADAARQLFEFGDVVVELAKPVKDHAPFVLERAVQLVRSATVCAGLINGHDSERIHTENRAHALCEILTPFAVVADRVLNDLVDQYGFRGALTPSLAQTRTLPPGHEDLHHALRDGIQVVIYWSDGNHELRPTTAQQTRIVRQS